MFSSMTWLKPTLKKGICCDQWTKNDETRIPFDIGNPLIKEL